MIKCIYLLLFYILCSCSTPKRPILTISSYTVDFGYINSDTIYEKEIIIYNGGTNNLVINRVSADCNCTSASIEKNTIEPNDSTLLHLSFDTRGKNTGKIENIIFIETNTDSICHFIHVIGYVK